MAAGSSKEADPPAGDTFRSLRPRSMASGDSGLGRALDAPDVGPWARAEEDAIKTAADILGTVPEALTASLSGPVVASGDLSRRQRARNPVRPLAFGLVVGGVGLAIMVAAVAGALTTRGGPPGPPSPPVSAVGASASGPSATSSSSANPPSTESTPRPGATVTPGLRTIPVTYRVRRGDTLTAIARRFQVTVAQLVETNRIGDPNLIYVNQDLVIPAPNHSSP